jgi:phosphatidylglycerol:prolipoprotein diacylglycerol transferase
MSYPDGVVPTVERVHPTPLYEMVLYGALFVFLWRYRHRPHPPGSLFGYYLILSGVARFAVEFVRRNPVVALGLTLPQWMSVLWVVAGASLLVHLYRMPRPTADSVRAA